MVKMKIYLPFAALLLASVPSLAQAQSSEEIEALFVESVRNKFPKFRIVKRIEDFPERFNASVELPIRAVKPSGSRTERALVTLHDGKTGEHMESCFTPCSLYKAPEHPVFVFPYKLGYFTFPNAIEADPAAMREIYPYWDEDYDVKLGPDFRKAYYRGKICEGESEKLGKTDRDAKPCYRMPPPLPDGDFSGSCKVIFDITPKGKVENAKATECTDSKFEFPSLIAVNAWSYHPKIECGTAVTQYGLRTTMKFDVTDFDGTLLDENGKRVEE